MKYSPMIRLGLVLMTGAGIFGVGANAAFFGIEKEVTPAGRVAELHSCELYTGGCTCSSEETMDGRYLLRVWQFDRGTVNGQNLAGLSVGVLQVGSENLAEKESSLKGEGIKTVAYLPESATDAQRTALSKWVQETMGTAVQERIVPLVADIQQDHTVISAGDAIQVHGIVPLPCDNGAACGESLWYTPRSETTGFLVDTTEKVSIQEPKLELNWKDHGRRTLFVGYFGQSAPSGVQLCGGMIVAENTP